MDFSQSGVRVRTLIMLRWIAIAGQLIALLVIARLFAFPLLAMPALLAIAASVFVNLGLRLIYPANAVLSGRQAAIQLAFDTGQLTVLLFLNGGLTNPFAILMLVPVTISATLLSWRSTFVLFLLAVSCTTLLSLWSLPLPWSSPQPLAMPRIYRIGDWVALLVGMTFLGAYAWRVSAEARRQQLALVATQEALARAQRMSAVGSLAAAAAHELGSPLGTMTLVARDLQNQLGNDPDFGADVALLNDQLARCRDILAGISHQTVQQEHFRTAGLEAVLREVARAHEGKGKSLTFEFADGSAALEVERSPELLHGLDNLVANAVRHARTRVTLQASMPRGGLHLRILDDGPGFPEDLLPHLGEPYVSSHGHQPHGLGLGIFIAITLLERIGGKTGFRNQPNGGGEVDIRWPPGA